MNWFRLASDFNVDIVSYITGGTLKLQINGIPYDYSHVDPPLVDKLRRAINIYKSFSGLGKAFGAKKNIGNIISYLRKNH